MATLNDVAKKANVSKMTVSRVINHPEQVTDELKKVVIRAMKELNYRPNTAAKALVNNRTLVIKFFILEKMSTTEPYYMNLLTGIAKGLDEHQYSLQLMTKNNFDIGMCDGYIMTGVRQKDYQWINGTTKPVVLFGENDHGYDFIDTDNKEGISMATKYVLDLGYDEIVYIGIDINEKFEKSRTAGYKTVMNQFGKKTTVYRFSNHSSSAAEFIEENWVKFKPNTAFVCSTDRLALGIERGILNKGGSIPDEYGIVGHDGVFLDQIAYPRLTTVKQPVVEMGEACARMILKKISENGAAQENQMFHSTLVKRESTRSKSIK